MSEDTKIVMQVPQDVISAQVQAAVADVLMRRGDDFIRDMVREVIETPVIDSYGRVETRRTPNGKPVPVTKFQKLMEGGVQKAALEEAALWVKEQEAEIKKAVRAYLGRTKKDVIANIADGIIENLAQPSVYLRIRFGEDGD